MTRKIKIGSQRDDAMHIDGVSSSVFGCPHDLGGAVNDLPLPVDTDEDGGDRQTYSFPALLVTKCHVIQVQSGGLVRELFSCRVECGEQQ